MTEDSNRGGARENAGRPPSDNPRNVNFPLRLNAEERAKLDRLGAAADMTGAAWIRECINLAPDPLLPPAKRKAAVLEFLQWIERAKGKA
jgi:hypothetical protein